MHKHTFEKNLFLDPTHCKNGKKLDGGFKDHSQFLLWHCVLHTGDSLSVCCCVTSHICENCWSTWSLADFFWYLSMKTSLFEENLGFCKNAEVPTCVIAGARLFPFFLSVWSPLGLTSKLSHKGCCVWLLFVGMPVLSLSESKSCFESIISYFHSCAFWLRILVYTDSLISLGNAQSKHLLRVPATC